MNNNTSSGISCSWNGQRWTPTVTNLQDQWTAQSSPGIARGKVWQPKAAPLPVSSRGDRDDLSGEQLEDLIANGYPLDLSTIKPPGSRQVESPLDLSLKTRKRCADSSIQQYHQSGKKMCFQTQDKRLIGRLNVYEDRYNHAYIHPQEQLTLVDKVSRDHKPSIEVSTVHQSKHHMQHLDPAIVIKHGYAAANQHLQNTQMMYRNTKNYTQEETESRQRYQTGTRSYSKSSHQQHTGQLSKLPHSDISKLPHSDISKISHSHISKLSDMSKSSHLDLSKLSHSDMPSFIPNIGNYQQRHDLSKSHSYPVNIAKERDIRNVAHPKYQRQDILVPNNSVVRNSDKYQRTQQNSLSAASSQSRYHAYNRDHNDYDFVNHNTYASFDRTGIENSRVSMSQQSRPSVLTGGLQFKQPQECCSPDSTFVVNSNSETVYTNRIVNSPVISRDELLRTSSERTDSTKTSRVSSTSYTPSVSPIDGFTSNNKEMISFRKSPSNKVSSKLTSPGSNTPESSLVSNQNRSIIHGTSGSLSKTVINDTVIRNPRPRLWNPDQTKKDMWKRETEDKLDETPRKSTTNAMKSMDNNYGNRSDSCVLNSNRNNLNDVLEIAIPTSKTEDSGENKPRPFSKKHIIMNAFRNDESMKHIFDEQPCTKTLQRTPDNARNTKTLQEKQIRQHESSIFVSPESPKMPTLSPQQKLPAPKVSPLMGDPPTLDLASSNSNRQKQNKLSPNRKTHMRNSFPDMDHNRSQDYSIQPKSNFPQRAYKKVPIANVAPMIHNKSSANETQETVKPDQDVKQFVSIPTQSPIHAFRVNTDNSEKNQFDNKDDEAFKFTEKYANDLLKQTNVSEITQIPKQRTTSPKQKVSKVENKTKTSPKTKTRIGKIPDRIDKDGSKEDIEKCPLSVRKSSSMSLAVIKDERKTITERNSARIQMKKSCGKKDDKVSHRLISNTKRKADEICRKARARKCNGNIPGCRGVTYDRMCSRFSRSCGFIDFKPEVLKSRTRRKSAGRKDYHRNAAYENELWREEKRKAVKHRQRVRRFGKQLRIETKTSETVPPTKESELTPLVDTNSQGEDNSGTWEVKNTSTVLRNGKSKGALSMKILFRPPEQRRIRRRPRKRGKIRYGVRKSVSSRAKYIHQTLEDAYYDDYFERLSPNPNDEQPIHYSEYNFDDQGPQQFIPSLPEVKKLSVCKDTGETILHRAARMGYEDAALSYLQTGTVDVNVRDNAGYTPLHESCVCGNMVIARMLLAYGAMVNCASQDGIRPIHDAVDNDFVPLVRLLLSYGADPTISTYGGKTPIKIAHSKKMTLLLQGYLGDINGFNEENGKSVWEFHETIEDDDIFGDIPSDPEVELEEDIFQECSSPMFNEITSANDERSPFVLLKDVSEFLHIKTGDILKDKSMKALIIEDGKEIVEQASQTSSYFDRLNSLAQSNCRLLQVKNTHCLFSKFEKKKTHDKDKKILEPGIMVEEKRAISTAKSPKHKTLNTSLLYDF